MILALIGNKPTKDSMFGSYWEGFLFNTKIQSYVEDFMCRTYHNDYFLLHPEELKRNKVGNFVYKKSWVSSTKVKVKVKKRKGHIVAVEFSC